MMDRQYIQERENLYEKEIKELKKQIDFFKNKSQRLEKEKNQLETNRDEVLDLIYSSIVANGEIIDQLRKIEVKRILEILKRGKE